MSAIERCKEMVCKKAVRLIISIANIALLLTKLGMSQDRAGYLSCVFLISCCHKPIMLTVK